MAFSKIIVAAIALMLASASAFMPAPSAALRATAVRSSTPHCSLRMSAGGDGSNPSHEEYVEKAKAWAAKNTHLSDAEIESSIKEGKHLVEQVYGSAHDVRKEGQVSCCTCLLHALVFSVNVAGASVVVASQNLASTCRSGSCTCCSR
jgi:hypothetical protein